MTTGHIKSSISPVRSGSGRLQCKRGFTLVEMLISLVLSSIIFISAYQVISNLIQYQVRYAEKSDKQMDNLLLKNMINQILAKGLHQSDLYFRIQKGTLFKGDTDSIQIISRAYSDHFDDPGYRVYRLFINREELFVSYKRYDKDSIAMNPLNQSSGIKIKNIAFEYYSKGEWLEEWNSNENIPKLIRVKVTWPDDATQQWIAQTGNA